MMKTSSPTLLHAARTRALAASLLLAGAVSGCSMAPAYQRPAAPVADAFPVAPAAAGAAGAAASDASPARRNPL